MSNDLRIRALLEDKVSSGLDKLHDKLDLVGGKGAAAVFTGNVAAKGLDLIGGSALKAGEFVGEFIGDSIKAASDLNETLGKSNVVFGNASKGVEAWGSTTADAFGISKQASIEAAASFGNVFKGLKIGESESSKMSEKLVELAGDLASFNNLDPTETLDKLRSGLAGEAEPLRSVGVFLTEAQVKAKAMELGLADANGELTEGAKVLARYNLILEQTKTAQGDFARTSDGLANSQRKANAELKDLEAELGQNMLPAQLLVTQAQSNFFKGLNLVADELGGKVTPAVLQHKLASIGQAKAIQFAQDMLGRMDDEARDAAVTLGLLTRAEIDAANGISVVARAQSDAAITFAKSAEGIADDARESSRLSKQQEVIVSDTYRQVGASALAAAEKAMVASRETETAFQRMETASGDYKAALLADKRSIVDDYFDVIITQDKLAATNAEIQAQKRIIASKSATDAEKRDARSALHQLEADQAGYLQDLATHGATSSTIYKKTMKSLLGELKTAHGDEKVAIQAEIDALKLLEQQAKNTERATAAGRAVGNALASIFGSIKGFAGGGHYDKGVPRLVGENGPEIDIPDHSGTILPELPSPSGSLRMPTGGFGGGAGSGGGTPLVIQFNSTWPPTPAQAREIAAIVDRELDLGAAGAPRSSW